MYVLDFRNEYEAKLIKLDPIMNCIGASRASNAECYINLNKCHILSGVKGTQLRCKSIEKIQNFNFLHRSWPYI
jgi:hypothetical protein